MVLTIGVESRGLHPKPHTLSLYWDSLPRNLNFEGLRVSDLFGHYSASIYLCSIPCGLIGAPIFLKVKVCAIQGHGHLGLDRGCTGPPSLPHPPTPKNTSRLLTQNILRG